MLSRSCTLYNLKFRTLFPPPCILWPKVKRNHPLYQKLKHARWVMGSNWRYYHDSPNADESINISPERIRNFSIVAHVDHGKSTLADRLLERTGVIDHSESNKQVLDRLPVERERGITVKAQTATMFYHHQEKSYMINLIDTPGHVDFNYEVSRSLAACQGVLLLVDAQQGVQAQTVANFLLASEGGLTIIPIINKIDLSLANVPMVAEQIINAFGFEESEIMKVSAKIGTGVDDILPNIINRLPSPVGERNDPLKMLLFDSWYDQYKGVICVMTITSGSIAIGDEIQSSHTGLKYEVSELGILQTKRISKQKLYSGQVGYIVMGMKTVKESHNGDTFHHRDCTVTPHPGFKHAKSMVFAGVYPMDGGDYQMLRTAIDKLTLNDSSVAIHPESSVALGQGWRLGFLGLLHMDVFRQRLEEEHDASVIITTPSVPYKALLKNGEEITILNPAQFPEKRITDKLFEPVVLGTLVFPDEYMGRLLKLCEDRRGIQKDMLYLDQTRVMLKYVLPLSEVILDFYDQIKSLSSGYASFDYEDHGYHVSPLVKLEVLLNGNPVDALSLIVHTDNAYSVGKRVCKKLKETIRRQMFEIAIQSSVGTNVIARETVKPLRKNVTAKCYGGDITRKMKLLKSQKEGKKKLKLISNVELSKESFLTVLER